MDKLQILLCDIIAASKIFITGFTLFMTVQLISYRGFGYNIYKTLLKYINKQLYRG